MGPSRKRVPTTDQLAKWDTSASQAYGRRDAELQRRAQVFSVALRLCGLFLIDLQVRSWI